MRAFLLLLSFLAVAYGYRYCCQYDGFTQPIDVRIHPEDNSTIVAEKGGMIHRCFNNETSGDFECYEYADLTGVVFTSGGINSEQGLLSIALHPNIRSNGHIFVFFTFANASTQIYRYTQDENTIDLSTARPIFGPTPQPAGNHNGGTLLFGPEDGLLYLTAGDGGGSGDPPNNAQDPTNALGTILRFDVDGGDPYSIPPGNPDLGMNTLPEILGTGMRHPWRASMDVVNNWLWIGDVGQSSWEEIDVIDLNNIPDPLNLGWKCLEGNNAFQACGNADAKVAPVHEYAWGSGACVVGGHVYYGTDVPELTGQYIFGDHVRGDIWSLAFTGNDPYNLGSVTVTQFAIDTTDGIGSFAYGPNGESYLIHHDDGEIMNLQSSDTCGACQTFVAVPVPPYVPPVDSSSSDAQPSSVSGSESNESDGSDPTTDDDDDDKSSGSFPGLFL